MNPKLFVFLGRSGCGKGTQAALLTEVLKKMDPSKDVFYVSTGVEFRKLIGGESYTSKKLKSVVDSGNFAPEFLASMLWASVITRDYKENSHMIIDGSPRKDAEASVFESVAPFYGLGKPNFIYMNVSKDWATDKLSKRAAKEGRLDDGVQAIAKRMGEFDRFLLPVIDSFRQNQNVSFFEINGEQTIDEVHKEIISKIFA